jgi:hypothetical protein
MKTHESIALGIPEIMLPRKGVDLTKWAVIACDQFTSEPEYWDKVSQFVGDAPSSLNLIYPEVYLAEKNPEARIIRIRDSMNSYLKKGLFEKTEGFIYVERTTGRKTRKGLVVCLDLEQYDFRREATSLIRATEGTILERIPPRVRIREGAPIEIPHIMVLVDDPENIVIGTITRKQAELNKLYEFDLMMDSGHLSGFLVDKPELETRVINSLKELADPDVFAKKYLSCRGTPVILFAMGDGNHSLATAKTIWEKTKESSLDKTAVLNSPLRYALVELVNLHDEALVFEPIHRALFDLAPGRDVFKEMGSFYPGKCRYSEMGSLHALESAVDSQKAGSHKIGVITGSGLGVIEVENPEANLPVGTLQNFLDVFLNKKGARGIDYVHGTESLVQLGKKQGAMGLYLPAMNKNDLFKTVIMEGVLPRKTFSMGEAWQKRFYMEARRLQS